MKQRLTGFTLCTLFGLGVALAAPQDQPSTSPSQADSARHSGAHAQMDPNRQIQRLGKRLNLTDDQKAQLLPILTDRQQRVEGLRNDSALTPQDRREKIRTVMEESTTKIKALLNDTQKQSFEQMEQQRRSRMQERHKQANPVSAAPGN